LSLYIVRVLRAAYPNYAWYHQGRDKRRERGVDFVGNRLGDARGEPASIGVQVKFHKASNAPTEREWLKFLAGCFARRLDAAVFVTTGGLTGEQRREAQEARVIVIEGRDEVSRLAAQHSVERFELFDDESLHNE
jgi:Restriction endonuclease